MLKSIVWGKSIHILGQNMIIEVESDRIMLRGAVNSTYFDFKDDAQIQARKESDEQFARMLIPVVGSILTQFLQDEKLHVLDLASSVAKITITNDPVEKDEDAAA